MRILYLTFFAPPLNSIPCLRTSGFLKYLPEFGVEIDVLTRYYDQKYLIGDDFFITHSPITELKAGEDYIEKNIVYSNFKTNDQAIHNFESLPFGLKTIFSFFQKDLYHKNWTKLALVSFEKHFAQNTYDFIVASYHPLITLHTASVLSKKYNIPWIADFRDTFIGLGPETTFSIFYKKNILNPILKSSVGIISVCAGMNQQLDKYGTNKIKKIHKKVVNNGVDLSIEPCVDPKDQTIVDEVLALKESSALLFLHTGTIYEGQNIEFFLDFIEQYNQKNLAPITLVCLGLSKKQIKEDKLKRQNIFLYERVQNSTSLYLQNSADVLIVPAWYTQRYTGFVGKIFEYIHTGNNVICSPNPVHDIKDLMSNFENVYISESIKELMNHIEILKKTRNKEKEKNMHPMLFRKYWIEQMADFLKELKDSR